MAHGIYSPTLPSINQKGIRVSPILSDHSTVCNIEKRKLLQIFGGGVGGRRRREVEMEMT